MNALKKIAPWIISCLLCVYIGAWYWLGGNPVSILRIYNTLQTIERAFEAGNQDLLVAQFAPDAQHRGLTTGRFIEGHNELQELAAEEANEDSADVVNTLIRGIRFASPDVVLIDVTVDYTNYRLGDLVWPTYLEHTFVVFIRDDENNWKLAHTNAGGSDSSLDEPIMQ